jgi:hypothetical protein
MQHDSTAAVTVFLSAFLNIVFPLFPQASRQRRDQSARERTRPEEQHEGRRLGLQ